MRKNSKKELSGANISANNGTTWEPVAAWYDDLLSGTDTYQSQVILPNLLRLIQPKGKTIIDIACGQGFFAKAFSDVGAELVVGADISPELITIARKNQNKKLHFGVAAADKINLKTAGDQTFDVASIVLAIQNIKEMSETFKEASRLLKPGGMFVMVLNHPCFRIPKASAWGFDEKTKTQYRRVDQYGLPFSVEVDMTPGKKAEGEKIRTLSFHRPLQEYFKALSSAGFSVVGLEEWISHKKSQPGPRAKAEDKARKEFPMFLTIIAEKN